MERNIIPKTVCRKIEPKLLEKFLEKSGKDPVEIRCIEALEIGADGSHCHECYFSFCYSSQSNIIMDCAVPDHTRFVCHGSNRADKKNINFIKEKDFKEYYKLNGELRKKYKP